MHLAAKSQDETPPNSSPWEKAVIREVQKAREAEVLASYPIRGSVPGWYFKLEETSNGAWAAEGTDLWGRKVACQGSDENSALHQCQDMALEHRREVTASGHANGEA